jgi:hypothetical protein
VLKLNVFDPKVSKYFRNMVQDTVNYREKNNIQRNGFMQLLIQLKNEGKVEEEHGYQQQNGHGNLEDNSGENGMHIHYLLYVVCCMFWPLSSVEASAFPTKEIYMTLSKIHCI